MIYWVLTHDFIYTSAPPGQRSPKIWAKKVHLCKCFEQTHASIFPVKSHIMQIRCHFDATKLNYKHVEVFLKTDLLWGPNIFSLFLNPWPNFIIKDLPSVLILIIADQISNDSLCCSNKYNLHAKVDYILCF